MAYDQELARRVGSMLESMAGISEKRMMGSICFLLNGNMVCGADRTKDGAGRFLFRVGKGNQQRAERLPGAEPMMQGGRRMSGFYFVGEEAASDEVLQDWLSLALAHVATLPAK